MAPISLSTLVLVLFLIPLALLAIYAVPPSAAEDPFKPKEGKALYDYRYVCDEKRFERLGLGQLSKYRFCDTSLSYHERARHLVAAMTLQEKVLQLGNKSPGVARLGIPRYNWWSEILHGVSDVGSGSSFVGPVIKSATSFPTPISLGAAFNESLWKSIGQASSTEARAMHNHGVAGLTFWSPNINIVRDPRWGRIMETPGEDPHLVGTYAVNFVRGLQDVEGVEPPTDLNTRPLKVSACCKHYAAYDVDYWRTFGSMTVERVKYNANVTERDMVESFNRPFEMCVKDGDVSSVMCSYNNVNGYPTCTNSKLLKGTIREEWNLHGYIVSDCDSVKEIVESQRFLEEPPEYAVAQTLNAGMDLDCGDYYSLFLEKTLKSGMIKESDVDKALINNYIVLLRLGWFDNMEVFDKLGTADVCSQKNKDLAADAARQGIVLLKNKDNTLPFTSEKYKKLAVVGPHANVTKAMIGNYAGTPCRYVSPIDALGKYAELDYKMGCADVKCHNKTYLFPAWRAAQDADASVIVAGLNDDIEREGWDRSDLELPENQNDLIKQVSQQSKGPVVLVILSAGGVNISMFINDPKIGAIVWAGYPGQEGGQAIADVIFGKYNPGGRLPVTWYDAGYVWKLPMTSMQFRPDEERGYPGRTYRFYDDDEILYKFGYGLSYTQFSYNFTEATQREVTKKLGCGSHCHDLRYEERAQKPPCHAALVSELDCRHDVTVEVQVTNTGKVDGSDVVMLYDRLPKGIVGAPLKQLVGFRRVHVAAGASETVRFELNACKSLLHVTETAYEVVPGGEHTFVVGSKELNNLKEMAFRVSFDKEERH